MLLVRGKTTLAVPFYGVGVFMPITVMGLAVRKHVLQHYTGKTRRWGARLAGFSAALSGTVFIGQIVGKWEEGGWVRLITFTTLFACAHLILIAHGLPPRRLPVRESPRPGAMARSWNGSH
jgi:hypothetical protein